MSGESESMYPTPRIVWSSGASNPRSILLRSELMCTSTTLLTLSKWMSQTCSMISDLVTGRAALRIRNSSSAYSLGRRSMPAPGAGHDAPHRVHLEVGHAQAFSRGDPRRSWARNRADSSASANGLTM